MRPVAATAKRTVAAALLEEPWRTRGLALFAAVTPEGPQLRGCSCTDLAIRPRGRGCLAPTRPVSEGAVPGGLLRRLMGTPRATCLAVLLCRCTALLSLPGGRGWERWNRRSSSFGCGSRDSDCAAGPRLGSVCPAPCGGTSAGAVWRATARLALLADFTLEAMEHGARRMPAGVRDRAAGGGGAAGGVDG